MSLSEEDNRRYFEEKHIENIKAMTRIETTIKLYDEMQRERSLNNMKIIQGYKDDLIEHKKCDKEFSDRISSDLRKLENQQKIWTGAIAVIVILVRIVLK